MSDSKIYNVPAEFSRNALIDEASYKTMYEESISDPAGFWPTRQNNFSAGTNPGTRCLTGTTARDTSAGLKVAS